MGFFTTETQKIVDAHKADFNCTNYESRLKAAGGYKAYVRSLGGVFAKYLDFDGKAETEAQFWEICEYVWGLFAIFGFDYYNGKTYVRHPDNPFYVNGKKGKCNAGRIDDLCGLSSKSKTTCCNWAVDSLLYKLGWLPNGTQTQCTYASYGKLITSKKELQPGDIVHFYRDTNNVFDATRTSTYSKSGWHHVVIVYKVTDSSIIVADGGSRFQINGGKWLYEVPVSGTGFGGIYGTSDKWLARRIFTMKRSDNLYRVRRSWADAESQIGAYAVLDNAKAAVEEQWAKGQNYTVYNSSGIPVWPFYRVRRSWDDASSQIGAFTYYRNAAFVADINEGFSVYDNWGNLLHEGLLPVIPVIVALKAGTKIYDEPAGNMVQELKEDGKFTIMAIESKGITYGQLKSGAGWVSLQKAERPE